MSGVAGYDSIWGGAATQRHSASAGLFDLERNEVLKGTRGTLFGRNPTAGTVNIVSHKPSDALKGYLNLRLPGRLGISDGSATTQAWPLRVR